MPTTTSTHLLEAAKTCLLRDGFLGLSTRNVAGEAGVPLSQIHYHFGSKRDLVLEVLRAENDRLLERQRDMFAGHLPLPERWRLACDYLDDDLASGYVRVLQEMVAAAWSKEEIALEVRGILNGWSLLFVTVATETHRKGADLGPFTPEDIAALVEAVFLGAESMILLGREQDGVPVRRALRALGELFLHLPSEGKQ